jgi:hypothetical protein
MKKVTLITLFAVMAVILCSSNCMACWLIYSKPAYKGRILDAETKKPIKGAVVVAVYYSDTIIGGPAGGYSSVVSVREALTDEKGEFFIDPYLTIFNPFMCQNGTKFIIYKAGYGSHPGHSLGSIQHFGPYPEDFFTEDIGKKGGKRVWRRTYPVTYGIVELPRRKTREERLRAMPGGPTDIGADDLPLFFKAKNEEYKRFGMGEVK